MKTSTLLAVALSAATASAKFAGMLIPGKDQSVCALMIANECSCTIPGTSTKLPGPKCYICLANNNDKYCFSEYASNYVYGPLCQGQCTDKCYCT